MFKALVMHLASRHLLPENLSWIGKLAEEVISRKTNESTQQHTACRQWHRQLERVQQAWPPQRVVAVAPLRELRTKPSRFCSPLPALLHCALLAAEYKLPIMRRAYLLTQDHLTDACVEDKIIQLASRT
jgi:hypothetical protein